MLTKEQIDEINSRIKTLGENIRVLEREKKALETQLVENAIEVVKSKYPGLQKGDKVKVVYKGWFGEKNYEGVFFLNRFHMCAYYSHSKMEDYVKVDFNKVKKDGTPSLRCEYINNGDIISMEKVTE